VSKLAFRLQIVIRGREPGFWHLHLKSEIKKTYASVSQEPEKDFIFPTGRPWAEDLKPGP
jgi:hypothetical protein